MGQKKKIEIIIVVLAVLLGVSLLALGSTILYSKLTCTATVTVPDNLITLNEDTDKLDNFNNADDHTPAEKSDDPAAQAPDSAAGRAPSTVPPAQQAVNGARNAVSIELYNKQPEENTQFQAGNMFPGDSETKYFRVRVSYHGTVTVHYKAVVQPGYEKLAEVLKVRVRLLTTSETLYDGGIADMPESLTHKLSSGSSTTDDLYYEITAYLDTSVGNEYQNRELIADFKWWAEGTGGGTGGDGLDDSPKTGDTSRVPLLAVLAACSGGVLIILTRKREEDKENA